MPKIATVDPAAKGIYKQKLAYWLRYSVDGVQHRVNLHTRDYTEAVAKATQLRGMPVAGKTERMAWKKAIAGYISDKLAGVKPPHLAGKRSRSFSESTADRTRGILEVFGKRSGAKSPQDVTLKHLQRYYAERRVTSEASAQTIINRVQAFLEHLGCLPGKVQYPSDAKKERRLVTVPIETSNVMIDQAPSDKLKYILYAGFHSGMRRGEIVQARPQWFDLDRRVCTVPGREDQLQANGTVYKWRSKDKETREIPLSEEFTAFLRRFLKPNDLFILEPDKCFRKARYRYDPRRVFENYMREQGRGDVYYHAMRHSFISNLCNSGNHSITEVAAWSGDTVEVIEKNYWHKTTRTGGLDATMRGKRRGDDEQESRKDIKELLQLVRDGRLSPDLAERSIYEWTGSGGGTADPEILKKLGNTGQRKRGIEEPWED